MSDCEIPSPSDFKQKKKKIEEYLSKLSKNMQLRTYYVGKIASVEIHRVKVLFIFRSVGHFRNIAIREFTIYI